MPNNGLDFDSEDGTTPTVRGQLSSNGHWIFGSIYAGLALIGFAFGVWAGAPKSKAPEVADAKKDPEKPGAYQPPTAPPKPGAPNPNPVPVDPPKTPDTMGNSPADPPADPPKPKPKSTTDVKPPDVSPKAPDPKGTPPDPKGVVTKPKDPDPKTAPAKVVLFKEVQPILRTYCFDCHGAAGKAKGDVDVTTVAKMLKSKGPPLVVGKPADSSLYLSIKSGDMPPDGKKGPNEKELQLLRDWIASGAKERRRPIRTRGGHRRTRVRRVELTPAPIAG